MSPLQILTSAFLLIAVIFALWWMRRERPLSTEADSSTERPFDQAWWIIVTTEQPNYEYFFGPFESKQHAVIQQSGCVKDLYDEGAINIKSFIRWCQPKAITSPGP